MKHRHQRSVTVATMIAGTLVLGSCAVQTVYPPYANNGRYDHDHGDEFEQQITAFPEFSPEVIKEATLPDKQQRDDKVLKKYLCAPFIAPSLPRPPRVDLTKLAEIAPNDHDSVKKLLLDNINDMNQHFKVVEKKMKDAYDRHRSTCLTRDIRVQ